MPMNWAYGRRSLIERLRTEPVLRDVASDQQDQGLRAKLTIDRLTASRFGITPQLIDDTLYDAFGQRQVSTMFTQLNQYRVILEVKPEFQKGPAALKDIYVHPGGGAQVPLSAFTTVRRRDRAARDQSSGRSSRRSRCPSIWRPALLWAMRSRPSRRRSRSSACRPASRPDSRVRRRHSALRCRTNCC